MFRNLHRNFFNVLLQNADFLNLHIKINLKINIFETNISTEFKFCISSNFKVWNTHKKSYNILTINKEI